jgi:ATP-dependent Clp protease adapter protein ClpS
MMLHLPDTQGANRPPRGRDVGGWLFRHTLHEPPPSPPEVPRKPDTPRDGLFAVRVLNNAVNTYQQVMDVCSTALGIAFEAAFDIAHTIDTAGSCVVCVAPRVEAERVAAQIGTIGIEVRVEPVAGSPGHA